ncbi:MAG: ribonuclease H-like domain-containing protein [Planctomycetes bacterium]|nr:ribonuclease H-like domain-containing protein [Planctomycetota bacterium]
MNKRHPPATVAFDIEVVGHDWSELDEATRGYLLERARKKGETAEEAAGKLALTLGLGKVVAIALWNLDEQRGAVLLEGPPTGWAAWPGRSDGAWLFRGDEKQLLEAFWERVRGYGRLVTFAGRMYDGPVLMVRSALHGVAPSRHLAARDFQMRHHCDLAELFTFQGAVRDHYKLDYWCRRFGIESPKSTLDGSQVDRAYKAGEIEKIGDYCLRDARATALLYERVKETLLPLLQQ